MVDLEERARAHPLRRGFWRHPRGVWVRRLMFQIHLWIGILLCVYSLVIGVSGSVLVFEDELAKVSYPDLLKGTAGQETASAAGMARAAENARATHSGWQLDTVYAPGVRGDHYAALLSKAGKYLFVFASANDGHLIGEQPLDQGWLNWVADLHFRLLGGRIGLIVNGIGAACLLILCITGAVIWWPGVKAWQRALTVDFRRRWQRINFDLHSATGFWTLAVLSIWAVSGVYFVWPQAFVATVNKISRAPNAAPPKFHLANAKGTQMPLARMLEIAMEREPGAALQGVRFSAGDQPAAVMLARDGDVSEFFHTSWVYFDPVRGKILRIWRYGDNKTAGDWFVWLMQPLHFGTAWGMAAKVLWALLGTALPLLAVTGVLMYWNRYLSKKWRALGQARAASGSRRTAAP